MSMAGPVLIRTYDAPPWDRRETLRYAGVREDTDAFDAELAECAERLFGELTYGVCYRELPVERDGACPALCPEGTPPALAARLFGCESVILLAATVGLAPDRHMARLSAYPAKALWIQAAATERVEALCDLFEAELGEEKRREGKSLLRRFSPGYGGLPLTLQKNLLAVLDGGRAIGLTLGENLLMSPTKSVTAMIGVKPQ